MKWSDLLLPKPKFATHNLSKTFRGSLSEGLLYPIYNRLMLPGDRFKIDLRSFIRTDPTVFPVMGSYKVRIVTVVANLKNYAIALEGYRKSFDWRSVTLPHFSFLFPGGIVNASDYDSATGNNYYPGVSSRMSVRETSLFDYLGYERGWFPSVQQYTNVADTYDDGNYYVLRKTALPALVYWDFYRNYMLNPQDGYFPCVTPYVDDDDKLKSVVSAIPAGMLDSIIEDVHKYYDGNTPTPSSGNPLLGSVNGLYDGNIENQYRDHWYNFCRITGMPSEVYYIPCTYSYYHGGLLGTMYDPDINTQWLSVANYERLNDVVINGTVAGQVSTTSFQDIVKASSLWQFMLGEVYGDGTYAGHINGQYGVDVKADMNIPQIIHVMDSRIDFENITSQSDTSSQQSDGSYTGSLLGQQAGVGRGYGQSGRFEVKNTDNNLAMLMTFMWITPEVDYSTGLNPDTNVVKLSDIYVPAFDNYSMQPRLQESVSASPVMVNKSDASEVLDPFDDNAVPYVGSYLGQNVLPADLVLGYQPAFAEYKTDINTVHGLFRSTMRDYTFLRAFPLLGLSRLTEGYISSYVYSTVYGQIIDEKDSLSYNQPFALARQDHFFAQVRFNITAIRPLSKSQIPNVK